MSAITATVQANGLGVDLNLDAALPHFLDLIADAYDADPGTVADLLSDLAQTRRELRRAQDLAERGDAPDHVAESLGAEADQHRQDLEDQLTSHVVVTLTHRQVVALQGELMQADGQTFAGRLGRAS